VLSLIKILGWLLAKAPLPAVKIFARFIGNLVRQYLPKRRYILESNLHHAFPDRSKDWRESIVRENVARLVEMGLLVLALPHLTKKQLQERIHISGTNRREYTQLINSKKPILLLVPHFTLYEYIPMIPGLMNWKEFNIAAIFRPLKKESLNNWIQSTRERFGVKLLSRQKGFNQARNVLAENGVLSVLFDQNARGGGTLMSYFGRIASTTELPRILAEHYPCQTFVFHSKRTSFWNAKMELIPLNTHDPAEIVQQANHWMETAFSQDDDVCADWLWMHDRWRILDHPQQRFALSHKKQSIDFEKITSGYRLWIRLDEDPELAIETMPLIEALKSGRPDAKITILLPNACKGELELEGIADKIIDLPSQEKAHELIALQDLQDAFPDTHLLLTQSTLAEKEAMLIKAPQRFGLTFPNSPRPALTHSYEGKPQESLLANLEQMLRHFGLKEEITVN
jgi:heptosyltransferase-2